MQNPNLKSVLFAPPYILSRSEKSENAKKPIKTNTK